MIAKTSRTANMAVMGAQQPRAASGPYRVAACPATFADHTREAAGGLSGEEGKVFKATLHVIANGRECTPMLPKTLQTGLGSPGDFVRPLT